MHLLQILAEAPVLVGAVVADDDEAYLEEDTCGLLFLNVREHLQELTTLTDYISTRTGTETDG